MGRRELDPLDEYSPHSTSFSVDEESSANVRAPITLQAHAIGGGHPDTFTILHLHEATMNTQPSYIGVDVAKHELVAAVFGQAGVTRCVNAPAAVDAWLAALPEAVHLGVESTGDYHRLLAHHAHARRITVYVLNPHDVRHYAKAVGRRAKTDRVDAAVLARYLAQEHVGLHPWQPPTPAQDRLTQLLKRRAKVVVAKGLLRASLAGLDILSVERDATLNQLDALLAAMDRELPRAVRALPQGTTRWARLRSIPGIGPLSGAALTELFSRVSFPRSDAVIAYLGLDPRPCDSGQRRGRRRLSKRGPAELRRLLYNAAMSAAKTAAWKPFYERQRAKGLSSTAALVVLARKLLRVAYALHKHETRFDSTSIAA